MLKQHQVRQHLTRSLIGGAMLSLLQRTEGMHLLGYNEGLDKEHGQTSLGADSNFMGLVAEGYSIDRIETQVDGTALAHCSRLVGLKYPVPGYSVPCDAEGGREACPARDFDY